MGAAEDIHLTGKDWLTEPEAAFYCGVSLRKFQMDVPLRSRVNASVHR